MVLVRPRRDCGLHDCGLHDCGKRHRQAARTLQAVAANPNGVPKQTAGAVPLGLGAVRVDESTLCLGWMAGRLVLAIARLTLVH